MNRTCIVVADGRQARFFGIDAVDTPRSKIKLVERAVLANPNSDLKALGESVTGRVRSETNTNRQAGPMHPIEAKRERHRGELDRRFVQEIVRHSGEFTRGWKDGTVVLVADPHLLGLLRGPLRDALHRGVELKELARNYVQLPLGELVDRLDLSHLISRRTGLRQDMSESN